MNFKNLFLFCKNTEESKQWYEKAGFKHVQAFNGMELFKIGDVDITLHPTDDKKASGDAQFYIGVEDVNTFFNQVKEAGIQPVDYQDNMKEISEPLIRPWGIDFGIVDPDGYVWVVIQDK